MASKCHIPLSVGLWRRFNAPLRPKLIAFQSRLPRRTGREKDRPSLHPWIHCVTCGGSVSIVPDSSIQGLCRMKNCSGPDDPHLLEAAQSRNQHGELTERQLESSGGSHGDYCASLPAR